MTIDTENEPLCECHNRAKRWTKDKRRRKGGYWVCRTKDSARKLRWDKNNEMSYYLRKRRWILRERKKEILIKLKELDNVVNTY